MNFVIVLACTVVLSWLLRKPLKKCPAAFYGVAILLNAGYLACLVTDVPAALKGVVFLLMQKCTLALALFAVVMFIGAFRKDSKVGLGLRPVRAELSILACILAVGHMVMYLLAFLPRTMRGGLEGSLLFFLATAAVLLILLLVLGITSFNKVKKAMDTAAWKKLQRWAYVFFGLIYVHLVSILLPSATNGGHAAMTSIAVYSVLFAAYAVARIGRYLKDKKE